MSYQSKESFIDYSQINAFSHHFHQGMSSPAGVKPALNLGQGLPHRVKVRTRFQTYNSHRGEVQTDSQT